MEKLKRSLALKNRDKETALTALSSPFSSFFSFPSQSRPKKGRGEKYSLIVDKSKSLDSAEIEIEHANR